METPTLTGKQRKASGSRAAARLRRTGKLPGIVYGHKIDPEAVTLDSRDTATLLDRGTHLVNLDIEGKVQACLFKDAQYDHLGSTLIHVDLTRVDLSERVKVHVEVELRGTPKGIGEGGVLRSGLKELEVECMVSAIPEKIRVEIGDLELDQVLHVKDLKLEAGLTALSDSEAVIAMVRKPTVKAEETEEAAAEAEAPSTEPEVIVKGKGEEDGAPEAAKK